MSKIALSGNTSGTGTLTIAAPNTNTDRTFNLPDASGTVLTDVSDIEAQVKTATNASGSAPVYACRAWVNFNGTTSPGTIRASGNVSSVTRNGTGNYNVNFTTAMPDANYALIGSSEQILGVNNVGVVVKIVNGTYTTLAAQFGVFDSTSTARDAAFVNISIFR